MFKNSKKILAYILSLFVLAVFVASCGGGNKETETTFKGKNVRVVIGSTSPSGDSYLIADAVSRHLGRALGANLKVDAVGAAEALAAMQTSKPDGNTIMIFHDMTYLGVSFGSFENQYALENMTVGPRVAQNPGAAWAAGVNAPYNTMRELAEYLNANPDAISRVSCEAGGVSHIGFIVYYDWVRKTYGDDVAKRIVVILGGSTAEKSQMLWDNNCDVIFADYTSLKDYTETDDEKIAMKFLGLLDNIDGIDVPSYSDLGITLDGREFRFSKDFLIYLPKDFPEELIAELDTGVKAISDEEGLNNDLNRMDYRTGYLSSEDSKEFIYEKRNSLQILIDNSPSLDDLVGF